MDLLNFQRETLNKLLNAMNESKRDIVLKSPTGSGKTIMLTHFMDEYLKISKNVVFIWLTPGKGNLEEQSKAKMDKYIKNSHTKLLADIMVSGFEDKDCCFINWEKLTKKGNNALKSSEKENFLSWIKIAKDNGLKFKVIIDESHTNFTEKADAIVQIFGTDKIIRCSATPLADKYAILIEVDENSVVAEGLIKKQLIINENFPQSIITNNQTEYLLEQALKKQFEILSEFSKLDKSINPLIVVQMPNSSDDLFVVVQNYLTTKGICIENGKLAVWLSNRHENLEHIIDNNGAQKVVIIKQAVATGWDCPRAHILVKLRDNMDETFEIQTIGRIRRMPEAKHYENEILDSCYLYTFDSKFTQGVKNSLGNKALDCKTIFLKNEYKNIQLTKEQRTSVQTFKDPKKILKSIIKYLKQKYALTGDKKLNTIKLEKNGYIFSEDIVRTTLSGKVVNIFELSQADKLNVVRVNEKINTTYHGREYHNRVGRLGSEIGLEYSYINSIIGKIFGSKFSFGEKVLSLEPRKLYSFIINNFDILKHDFRESMAAEIQYININLLNISEKDFKFPLSTQFTYRGDYKVQTLYSKNVYDGYLSSAEPRSNSEKKFEKFCERNSNVEWFYKNGDKGEEYLSIVYYDNSNAQKLFYPDYIVCIKGKIWIVETKGGFTKTGDSQDIDLFSPKKFKLLKSYLKKHSLNGGFVRFDAASDELCIARNEYNDDISSEAWELLEKVVEE